MASDASWNPDLWLAAGGAVPDGWRLVPFAELLETPKSISVGVMYPGENTSDGVPLIRIGDVTDSGAIRRPSMRVSAAVHNEYRRTELAGNELLITLVGNPGVCIVAQPEMKGWNVARALAVARLKTPDLRAYVKALMESGPMRSIVTSMLNTTVQPTLNLREIKNLPIPLPEKIEDALDVGAFASMFNDRIDNLRQTNATLEAIAQALFKSWFVDFDGVPPEDMQESELGLIPKGWRVEEIGKLVQCVGGATPSTKNDAFWQGGTHHWATPKDLSGLQAPVLSTTERLLTDEGVAHVSSGVLPAGTLLMSSRAPIGYLAIAAMPVAINQGFIAMPPGGVLSPIWLLFWAKVHMEAIKQKANGSTFMEISKAAFRPIKIIAPPNGALAAFDEAAAAMMERIKINEHHIATLAALRDALLPRLMSGKLRVGGSIAGGWEAG